MITQSGRIISPPKCTQTQTEPALFDFNVISMFQNHLSAQRVESAPNRSRRDLLTIFTIFSARRAPNATLTTCELFGILYESGVRQFGRPPTEFGHKRSPQRSGNDFQYFFGQKGTESLTDCLDRPIRLTFGRSWYRAMLKTFVFGKLRLRCPSYWRSYEKWKMFNSNHVPASFGDFYEQFE